MRQDGLSEKLLDLNSNTNKARCFLDIQLYKKDVNNAKLDTCEISFSPVSPAFIHALSLLKMLSVSYVNYSYAE